MPMRYTEIKAKTILNKVKGKDDWFGLTYTMNLYRGCEHQCIYCDTRSECYGIEAFEDEVLVKINGVELLRWTLPKRRLIGTIGFGSMNDPYTLAEAKYGLTSQALGVIAEQGWPVHILTKSDMVLKDLEKLKLISTVLAQVSFSLTTTENDLAKKLEPGASSPSQRLKAMQILAESGIRTGLIMMPVLPFITDNELNLTNLIEKAYAHKASYIIPAFGVTLRDRQRAYFYRKLDEHFPGLRARYEQAFGDSYSASTERKPFLEALFNQLCLQHGLATHVEVFQPRRSVEQLGLFSSSR